MSNERNELYDFNIGHSTAYAYAKASGDLPEGMTPDEYGKLLAAYATVGQTAVDAKDAAVAANTAAQTAATTATNKASEATTAAQTATTKASEASTSASTATSAKDTAVSASQTATSKATEATTAAETANTAKTDAETAKNAAETAQGKAEDAQAAAEAVAESIPSDYSQLSEDVTELKSDLTNGFITLTSSAFSQGAWSMTAPSETVSVNERNIRVTVPIHIKKGDILITKQSTLYIRWTLFDAADAIVEEYKGKYDKDKIVDKTHVFTHDGTLYINIANGHNWGNSSAIVPSDMTATIQVATTYAYREIAPMKADVETLKEYSELIFSKRIDITANASTSNTWFYYPLSFLKGHTYYAKIKFDAFVSTNNRKYSLRTTTYTSTSSSYFVQMIAVVDGTNPTIGEEYAYKFVAEEREDGGIGKYLVLELNVTGASSCTVEVYSVKAEDALPNDDAYSDIVTLNYEVPDLIRQGTNPFNRSSILPLSLLHFSDIHGKQDNLSRMVEIKESLGSLLDDTICTGDMVVNNYSATCMDFWNAVDGAEDILLCLGNHELADGEHGYSSDQIGQTVAYQKYFSPYISNWGVTPSGANLTYWHKDYESKKVRVIALNYLLTGDEQTAQNTWLASRLAEAKTSGYAVVIVEHTPLNSFTKIDCNFSIVGLNWGYNEFPTIYQDTVQSFIDGGGEFACYLAGHCHCDYVGYNSNYPDQLCIAITTAQTTRLDNDQRRVVGEKSQDAGNVVLIDTVTKTVKLIRVGADMDCYLRGRNLFSINYNTKTVIAES